MKKLMTIATILLTIVVASAQQPTLQQQLDAAVAELNQILNSLQSGDWYTNWQGRDARMQELQNRIESLNQQIYDAKQAQIDAKIAAAEARQAAREAQEEKHSQRAGGGWYLRDN